MGHQRIVQSMPKFCSLKPNAMNFVITVQYKRRAPNFHTFGHISTKKREMSRAFVLRKRALLYWSSFDRFFPKASLLFSKA
jgi:hypothetical protein